MKGLKLWFCSHAAADDPSHLTLKEIMIFFSGTDKIPLTGFTPRPSITFDQENPYPTTSTCAFSLVLPSQYRDYATFKDKVTFGVKNHGGFGLL